MARKILNGLDLVNQRVVNLGDPSASTDAANKQYVDNVARGLIIKDAVRVASTADITVANPGTAVFDGVTLTAGDRVLLKNQTTASQNGIYQFNGAGSALTRTLDADSGTELRSGTSVFVTEGTVNGDKQYVITSDAPITIGTTAMTWTLFGGGTTYTGSNGVSVSGNNITGVAAPSGGLTVGASGFSIDTSVVARKISGNIGNGSLTTIAVTHNLGTLDVDVTLRQTADNMGVETDWVATDTNTVTFTFAPGSPPASNAIRFTIMG